MGSNIIETKAEAAMNFPTTISRGEKGRVINNSYEPVFNSSENNRIVTAGMINEKVIGRREKKPLSSAWLNRKKVEKKNQPVSIRKIEITIYAIGETKYPLNSFFKTCTAFSTLGLPS